MRQGRLNLIFGLIILILIVYILLGSINYEEFNGISGSGYSFGFSLTVKQMIAGGLLILSIPLYFLIKKKSKNAT